MFEIYSRVQSQLHLCIWILPVNRVDVKLKTKKVSSEQKFAFMGGLALYDDTSVCLIVCIKHTATKDIIFMGTCAVKYNGIPYWRHSKRLENMPA